MTSLDNFFAVLLRLVVMVCVYYILFQKFHRQYQKSKDSGHENAYFKGFTVFFFIMTVFHVLYGTYELYLRAVPNPLDIKARFSWFQDPGGWVSTLVNN